MTNHPFLSGPGIGPGPRVPFCNETWCSYDTSITKILGHPPQFIWCQLGQVHCFVSIQLHFIFGHHYFPVSFWSVSNLVLSFFLKLASVKSDLTCNAMENDQWSLGANSWCANRYKPCTKLARRIHAPILRSARNKDRPIRTNSVIFLRSVTLI